LFFALAYKEFFCNFAVRLIQSRLTMNYQYAKCRVRGASVQNFAFKENWKSTASMRVDGFANACGMM